MSCCGRSGATGAGAFGAPNDPQPAAQMDRKAHAAMRLRLCGMSFFARRRRAGWSQGQAYAKMRAAALRFEDFDAAAVGIDELGDHRKPDSGALDVPALRRFSLIERFEDPIALIRGNAGTAVHDIQYQLLAL